MILARLAMRIYRFGHWVYYRARIPGFRHAMWFLYRLLDFLVLRVICGAEIPAQCHIGKGATLFHNAFGIIIHPEAVIGDGVYIYHQVTIGQRSLEEYGAPKIGHGVFIGAGAKVLGTIEVGDGARIGANAVVLCDVPPGATAVGVPARVLTNGVAIAR